MSLSEKREREGLKPSNETRSRRHSSTDDEWGVPIPLTHSTDRVPTFPIETFPEWMHDFADALSTELQVPIDLPALLILGVAGAGIARKVIVIPRDGWEEPTNLFIMTVLPPGDRKSQTCRKVLAPVVELERDLIEAMKPEIAKEESEHRIAKKRVDNLENKIVNANASERSKLLEDLATAREEMRRIIVPSNPVLRVDDDTPEMMEKELVLQGGRLLAASPEIRALENIKQYSNTPKLDVYLKGHAGDDLRSGRISRGRDEIDRAALSCLFTPQPSVIAGLAETPELRGRGFLARWFYAMPTSKVGYREVSSDAIPLPVRSRYESHIRQLWQVDYLNDGKPHVLCFEREADRHMEQFQSWVEGELRPEGSLAEMAGWGSKLCGLAARIAGILHAADGIGSGSSWMTKAVSVNVVQRAVTIAKNYAIPHVMAAFDMMGTTETIANTWKLWKKIAGRDSPTEPFSKRDAFILCRVTFGTVDRVDPAIDLLERHFLIRSVSCSTRQGPGRKPSPMYEVNPSALESQPPTQNAHNTQNDIIPASRVNSVYSVNCVRGAEDGITDATNGHIPSTAEPVIAETSIPIDSPTNAIQEYVPDERCPDIEQDALPNTGPINEWNAMARKRHAEKNGKR